MSEKTPIDWEAVARAGTHPLRLAILDHLSEVGVASPSQMHLLFKEPLGNVSYHVKTLAEAGLLDLSHTEPRRGAVEHYYCLSERARKR
jgi:DNA-binding transcriptional ArsR family regulator